MGGLNHLLGLNHSEVLRVARFYAWGSRVDRSRGMESRIEFIYIFIYQVGVLQLPSNKNTTADNGSLLCLFIFMAAASAGVQLLSPCVKKVFTVSEIGPISDANEGER